MIKYWSFDATPYTQYRVSLEVIHSLCSQQFEET